MIEAKYGLKYSFPHSLVHIVDNSGTTVTDLTAVADDPSLYSTIVVTGLPIGEDRRVVNVTRSDVVNVAFGASALSKSDIDMYGQSVEYPASLIEQGAPVQLLRVTPPDAEYAFSTILIEWKLMQNGGIEVRFKAADRDDQSYGWFDKINELSRYQNTDRLNAALVNGFKNDDVNGWKRRVFINNIAAGRGSNYNYMSTYINKTKQPKRPNQIRYEFGTIDGRTSNIIETFIAALINDPTQRRYSSSEMIDTVNTAVKKRPQGSSVVIPYVNESAIRDLFEEYKDAFSSIINTGTDADYKANTELYTEIFKQLNINTFDPVYGTITYSGIDDVELPLPYFTVDMYDADIVRLDKAHLIKAPKASSGANPSASALDSYEFDANNKVYDWAVENFIIEDKVKSQLCGVSAVSGYTGPYVGDVYFVNTATTSYFSIVTSINQYSGVVKSSNAIYNVYVPQVSTSGDSDTAPTVGTTPDTTKASVRIKRVYLNVNGINDVTATTDDIIKNINKKVVVGDLKVGDVIVATGATSTDTDPEWKLYYVSGIGAADDTAAGKITALIPYNMSYIHSFLDYSSAYNGTVSIDEEIIRMSTITGDGNAAKSDSPAWNKIGALRIDDRSGKSMNSAVLLYFDNGSTSSSAFGKRGWATISTNNRSVLKLGEVPTATNIVTDLVNVTYDLFVVSSNTNDPNWYASSQITISEIRRATVARAVGSTYRVAVDPVPVPTNYYASDYGDSLYSEAGGIALAFGSTGFFDDYENGKITSIEFKWKYSELLVKAFKGEIDPRIKSPNRVPAKFMFDGGWNTVVGLTRLPFNYPDVEDVIYASTVFTDDEKDALQGNIKMIADIKSYVDIDVKQAMYDLMIYRLYQGIPEEKRPVGPGSGLSLHLDAGITDAATALLINKSFNQRFDNPNASWDIGGITSAVNGVTYTYVKKIVDNLIRHSKLYTVNKPYVNQYTTIYRDEYTSYFPDVDATDWELRELLYNSGGNAWLADTNGNITRRSQRTLKQDSTTSDLIQENNMRTLSQLVYLLQNKIDTYLLEYDDDGVLQTMSEDCNNMFAGWVGTRVQALSIRFEKDTNIDGGNLVVCYVDVTFRGLILRVPIIVNVQRRTGYGE